LQKIAKGILHKRGKKTYRSMRVHERINVIRKIEKQMGSRRESNIINSES
jgi:hypothetical protein